MKITHPSFRDLQGILKSKGTKNWKSFITSAFQSGNKETIDELFDEDEDDEALDNRFFNDPAGERNISTILQGSKSEAFLHKSKYSLQDYAKARREILLNIINKMNLTLNGNEGKLNFLI